MSHLIPKLEFKYHFQVENNPPGPDNQNFYFRLVVLLILTLLFFENSLAQENQLTFNILKKDRTIGILEIQKIHSSPFTDYKVSTSVEVSFIKKFRVEASEKYRYEHDRLIYSEVNRTINDKPRNRKELKFGENRYLITDGDESRILNEPNIQTNLVQLYFAEPLNVYMVYCDNQQIMVDLENIGNNRYRLQFPNGVSNIFHYQSGKCIKVDVEGKFFQVSLQKK